jgi:RNA polymerase sigma factor (sigma-70 family)
MNQGREDFARVYDDHVWAVYGFLAYRLGNRDVAEDLTQTTFERALRAWSRFDPRRGSERTWLVTIARNTLIDHVRHAGRTRAEPLDERSLSQVALSDEGPSQSPELIDALAQLPERERELLALRYGGDLTGPEIAKLVGLSLANVQQINSRALRKLRALLDEGPQAHSATTAPSAISSNPSAR